jgi:hypothetical protein
VTIPDGLAEYRPLGAGEFAHVAERPVLRPGEPLRPVQQAERPFGQFGVRRVREGV